MKFLTAFIVLIFFIECEAQEKEYKTYPINIHFNQNKLFNIRINQAMSSYGYFPSDYQSASLSFSVTKNLRDKSEMLYSINPLLLLTTVISNQLEPNRDSSITFSIPIQIIQFIFQNLANTKFEPTLFNQLRLAFGLDTDYYFSKYGFLISMDFSIGPKYTIGNCDISLCLDYQGLFFLADEINIDKTALRLNFAYILDKNKISEFISYCR